MNELVELGLRKPSQAATVPPATPAAGTATPVAPPERPLATETAPLDQFLQVLSDWAPDADPQVTTKFQESLGSSREQMRQAAGRDRLKAIARCLDVCERYLRDSQHYIGHREHELKEIIALLRRAATQMAGESSDFSAQVIQTSERVLHVTRLDDIRELRHHLAAEVTELRRSATAKQKRDQETFTELTTRVETLQSDLARVEEEASLDALTKVANRGSFDRTLRRMMTQARRTRSTLSVAMVDIDHFKTINDLHGHPVGDRVILCVAQWLQRTVRKGDCVSRYGGEEFAILLTDARLEEVEARFTRLVAQIAEHAFDYDKDGEPAAVRFTVSCGIAELEGSDNETELVRRADEALYEAKRKGRNRVMTKRKSLFSRLFSG